MLEPLLMTPNKFWRFMMLTPLIGLVGSQLMASALLVRQEISTTYRCFRPPKN